MSILIRDMTMPNRCFECIFLTTVPNFFCLAGKRDLCAEHGININRPDWCPLVEIPTPHGRLVDIKSVEDRKFTTVDNEYERWWNGALDSVVDNAPTVIEAEGNEE